MHVIHKSYLNPSKTHTLELVFDDGRIIVVPPMHISKRLRVYNPPTIIWKETKNVS